MAQHEMYDVAALATMARQSRDTVKRSQTIEDRIQGVLELYVNQQRSVREIQREIGVSPSETYRILADAGLQPNAPHSGGGIRLFTDTVEEEIATAYTQGESMESLATRYDACRSTIKHVLQRQSVVLRNRGSAKKVYPEGFVEQLVVEWQAGMSQKAIGKKYGLSETQVYGLLKPFPAGTREKKARRSWHPNWKGGRRNTLGYVLILLEPSHPFYAAMATGMGYVLEHRLVMAESLGRPLAAHESVHHIDGVRSNNRLENLQLRQGRHGSGVVYHCADCGSTNVVANVLADDEAD